MKVSLRFHSATTAEARALARQCRAEGLPAPRMYGMGPESWNGETDLETDLPSGREPLAILRALAAAYAADGAADQPLPSGNAAPVYLALRPESAGATRRALIDAAYEIRRELTAALEYLPASTEHACAAALEVIGDTLANLAD